MLACFKVPVGTATASCPSAISAPHKAVQLFGTKLDQVDDQSKSAAKLAVHLLKQPQRQGGAAAGAAAVPAAAPASSGGLEKALSLGLGPGGSGSGVMVQGILRSRTAAQTAAAEAERTSSSGVLGLSAEGSSHAAAGAAGEDVAVSPAIAASADALDSLVQLLEQYCHPSNTGSWSGDLAVFLRHGLHYFMKVGGQHKVTSDGCSTLLCLWFP